MALIGSLQHFAITHIRREHNAGADRLAREAIDRATREKPAADAIEADFVTGNPRKLVQLEQPG